MTSSDRTLRLAALGLAGGLRVKASGSMRKAP